MPVTKKTVGVLLHRSAILGYALICLVFFTTKLHAQYRFAGSFYSSFTPKVTAVGVYSNTDSTPELVLNCPTITIQPVSQTDCDGNQVSFTASINPGVPNYTYTWYRKLPSDAAFSVFSTTSNTTSTSSTLTVANIGNAQAPDGTLYYLVVTDATPCSVTSNTVTLNVNEITGITPAHTTSTLCAGSSFAYTVNTIGSVNSYQWYLNNVLIPGANSAMYSIPSASASDVGTYKVVVTFDVIGSGTTTCQRTSTSYSRQILLNPTLTGPSTLCIGSTGNVYNTDIAKTNYIWTISGGIITSGGTGNNSATVNWNTPGTGTITVVYTDPNTGCTPPVKSYSVTVNALPTVTCPANSSVCINDAAFALSDGSPSGGTYSGPGVSGSNFNPATAGVGTHTITYAYTDVTTGCTDNCQFTITVNSFPVATAGSDITTCTKEL